MDSQVLLVAHFEKGPPQRLVVERLGDLTPAQQKAAQAAAARAADDAIAFFNRGKTLKTSVPSLRKTSKNAPAMPSKKLTIANAPMPSKKPTVANAPVVPSKKPTVANAPVPSKKSTVANAPSEERPAFLSDVKWTDNELDLRTLRALTETMGYEYMSKVQAESLGPAKIEKDLFVKAKTGTGKTVGFLVPVIEQLAKNPPAKGDIGALIISHNRDLAHQLHVEAEKLLTFHDLKAQVVVGGEPIGKQQRKLANDRVDILIGTPGRLVDHLESTPGFAEQLSRARILVLDEADQLLESGFKKSLDAMVAGVSKEHQTLLFTATVPEEVKAVAATYLKPEHMYLDTVGEEEQTHSKVPQEFVVVEPAAVVSATYSILNHQVETVPDSKIVVFFPTARQTQFMAELFNEAGMKVMEMHSRLSQSQRNRTSEQFRDAKSAIMFSSDVSARGMDFPGVTFVLQVGLPDSVAQYTHRIGRTGRAGASGAGVLLVFSDEQKAIVPDLIKGGIPIQEAASDSSITGHVETEATGLIADTLAKVGTNRELRRSAQQAYGAWLGFYNGHLRRLKWTKADLVAKANGLFTSLGLQELPAMQAKTLGKMGLRGVPGIREAGKDDAAVSIGGNALRATRRRVTRRVNRNRTKHRV